MADQVSVETLEQLQRYLDGEISNEDLAGWLTGMEYESSLAEAERDVLAGVRLVLIEVEEGRRDPDEVLARVAEALARSQPGKVIVAARSGSNTTWEGETFSTGATSRPQRAGISP